MMPRDVFYTPRELADKLISYVPEGDFDAVADFCVGDGDLLKAVERRFPNRVFYGTDIEGSVIDSLKRAHPSWHLSVCDFTDKSAFQKLPVIGTMKFDLIVLNPPFTCRGGTICRIDFDGRSFRTSTAMLFVLNALKHRSEKGVIYAILPSSCAYSQKDSELWRYLEDRYNLQTLEEPNRMYWKNCSASIILVRVGGDKVRGSIRPRSNADFSSLPIDFIVRGHISPHMVRRMKEEEGGIEYVHTTNLQGNRIVNCCRIFVPHEENAANAKTAYVRGPAVLLPRVCNPNIEKVCIYEAETVFVPSDCIIAIKTTSVENAQIVSKAILDHWEEFRTIYQGTAAKYTTMERLKKVFK